MVVAQKLKESEITEQDSLLLTRNLLRIAIFNITYIRKLFPEKYFSDKSVPALPEMKIKKLMPMDAESDRLINWMEKGVYDALQKKYLKTLLFSVCEAIDGPLIEEYAFSFCYSNTDSQDVSMNINRTGMKKGGTFKCNSTSELTPSQMRSSACKMVRTLIQLMRTLDKMPEERTLLMKLLYYTDVTPADYEPPFFRSCTDDEALNNTWTKNPLKIEVGNVNSKHIVLALKIKSSLDPCEDEKDDDNQQVNLDADSSEKIDSSSDSELIDSDDESIVTPVEKQTAQDKGDDDMVSEDDTQDPVADEQQFGRVKDWISTYHIDKVEVTDVLSNFPDVSVALIEEILGKLVKEGILSSAGTDTYIIIKDKKFNYEFDAVKEEMDGLQNQNGSQSQKGKDEDNLYMKALFHALPMTYVSISKLQSKLEGEANQTTVKKLIDKMTQDGFVEAKSSRKLGKRVIRSDMTEKKLSEVKKVLANNDAMDVDTPESDNNNKRDLSTCGAVHSIGSELTRTKGKSDSYQNGSVRSDQTVSKRKDHEGTPSSKAEPVASLESFVPAENGRVTGKINHHDEPDIVCSRSNQNKRRKKESMVKEPIILNVTHQSSTFTDKKSA